MLLLLAAIVLIAYGSLVIELTILHVPSVASSLNIWSRPPTVETAYSPSWRSIFGLSRPRKFALFILPVLVAWGVFIYPLIAVLGPGDPLGDHVFRTTTTTNALAALLIVVGRSITLGSVLALRRDAGRAGRQPTLSTDGPFRFSRNPGLVGMYVFVVGLWVAAPSLAMLSGILVYVLYMDFKVRMEEDYLGNTLGELYQEYRRRTGRYLL